MSDFVKKASSKIDKLSDEQIIRVLQGQQQKLSLRESVLNTIQEGFAVISKDFKIVYFNDFFHQVLGCPQTKGNTTITKFFSDEGIRRFIREAMLKKDEGYDYFFPLNSSLYGEMEIRVTSTAIPYSENRLFVFKDFTFMRKLYDEFRRSESLAAMTTMAAGVAHEIKNPLASISIYIQLLQRKLEKNGSITEEDAKQSLSIISEEIERLNKIAVDFLFAVKPLKVNMSVQDINSVVGKAIDIARPEVEQSGTELSFNPGSGIPNVNVDSALIEQCILNLLRNSLQALCGKKNGKITVNTYLDGNYVKVSVTDDGCGMSEEVMSKIFEPYYTTKASGTGLGLTNIYKIVKEHEGDINVNSTEGEGSVFAIQIPVPKSQRFRIQGDTHEKNNTDC